MHTYALRDEQCKWKKFSLVKNSEAFTSARELKFLICGRGNLTNYNFTPKDLFQEKKNNKIFHLQVEIYPKLGGIKVQRMKQLR